MTDTNTIDVSMILRLITAAGLFGFMTWILNIVFSCTFYLPFLVADSYTFIQPHSYNCV